MPYFLISIASNILFGSSATNEDLEEVLEKTKLKVKKKISDRGVNNKSWNTGTIL